VRVLQESVRSDVAGRHSLMTAGRAWRIGTWARERWSWPVATKLWRPGDLQSRRPTGGRLHSHGSLLLLGPIDRVRPPREVPSGCRGGRALGGHPHPRRRATRDRDGRSPGRRRRLAGPAGGSRQAMAETGVVHHGPNGLVQPGIKCRGASSRTPCTPPPAISIVCGRAAWPALGHRSSSRRGGCLPSRRRR
jgi:hypothetical protein